VEHFLSLSFMTGRVKTQLLACLVSILKENYPHSCDISMKYIILFLLVCTGGGEAKLSEEQFLSGTCQRLAKTALCLLVL
jgi:hypothetical protein